MRSGWGAGREGTPPVNGVPRLPCWRGEAVGGLLAPRCFSVGAAENERAHSTNDTAVLWAAAVAGRRG